ncbi:unnamed protein product [Choristocarpus tenellus]
MDIIKPIQAYQPQGISICECIHPTMHGMLTMYSNMDQSNWASLLSFVQLAHNTAYNTTVQETPFFLMFGGRQFCQLILFGRP